MPGLNIQLKIPAGNTVTGWAGFDYKRLRPELRSATLIETNSMIGSVSAFANLKIKTKPLNISLMGTYSQNGNDMVMIGGYGVTGITDLVTGKRSYTNLSSANFWADLNTTGKKFVFGLFTGFSKNLGAGDDISGPVYGRGTNIDHLFRISPRVILTEGRLSFGAELETTTAAYGTMENNGKVTDTDNVSNVRVLLSTVYKF
jgi:hypothetical protein